jgi:hypothetical protein
MSSRHRDDFMMSSITPLEENLPIELPTQND